MDREISAYLVKLRREHPFLATLSLYMDYQFTDRVEHFDTDGRKTRINPQYFGQLDADERIGTLLHVTLHSALLHPIRRGARESAIWNIAADIVANEIIAEGNFQPPPRTAFEPRYAGLSVEQVYAKLLTSARHLVQTPGGQGQRQNAAERPAPSSQPQGAGDDRQNGALASARQCDAPQPVPGPQSQPAGTSEKDPNTQGVSPAGAGDSRQNDLIKAMQTLYPATSDLREPGREGQPNARAERKRLESYWKQAITRAHTVEQLSSKTQGDLPAGLARAIDQVLNPQLDWRTMLWRFMAKTPCDYSGFDRRFVHQGLYLDHLEGESLTVHIAIDTSGSIDDEELAQFRAEVESIMRCYATIKGQLYFVDADVYGPYPMSRATRVAQAQGGGGTDFDVFFEQLESHRDPFEEALCIYLTDGFGEFPDSPPPLSVLWVVTSDGRENFPFGEVARLIH